jgi:hypothetical protein
VGPCDIVETLVAFMPKKFQSLGLNFRGLDFPSILQRLNINPL